MRSVPQIHQLLQNWGLIPGSRSIQDDISPCYSDTEERNTIPSFEPTPKTSEDGECVPASLPSESDIQDMYRDRPLPSLPAMTPSTSCTAPSTEDWRHANQDDSSSQSNENGMLTASQEHCNYKVEAAMEYGSLPLEAFLRDDQAHERLAIGLDRTPRTLVYSRAYETRRYGVKKATAFRRRSKDAKKRNKPREHDDEKDI